MLNPVSWEPCFAARPVWQGLGGCKVSLKTRYFRLSCFIGRHWSPYLCSHVTCFICAVLSKRHTQQKVRGGKRCKLKLFAWDGFPSFCATMCVFYVSMYVCLLMSCALSIHWWDHRHALYLIVGSLDDPPHSISSLTVCHTADFHTQIQRLPESFVSTWISCKLSPSL